MKKKETSSKVINSKYCMQTSQQTDPKKWI